MREATISLAILLAVFGIYVYVNRDTSSTPPITQNSAPSPVKPITTQGAITHVKSKSVRKPAKPAVSAQQRVRPREDAGPAIEPEEVEGVPSIYSSADQPSAGSAESGLKPKKNLHGVPVAAWLESRQNSLPNAPVSGDAPDALRLFVQCMEMKKDGSRPLTERDCRALTARTPGDESPRRNGLPSNVY